MDSHHHPDYEETFSRIATILDVIAQEQLAQQRAHAETDRTLREFIAHAKETDRTLREFIAHTKERDAETTDKLDGLIQLMDRHLREQTGH
jgi:hypothetical protein